MVELAAATISGFALVVSVLALWYTLSARAFLYTYAVREYHGSHEAPTVNGDILHIVNLGREAALLHRVVMRTTDGREIVFVRAEHPTRKFMGPDLPAVISPGELVKYWLPWPKEFTPQDYRVTLLTRKGFRGKRRSRTIAVTPNV